MPPVVKDLDVFRALAKAGQRLAEIHVHYEKQPEYPLLKTEKAGEKLDYRVTRMRLSKDKTTLIYNDFLDRVQHSCSGDQKSNQWDGSDIKTGRVESPGEFLAVFPIRRGGSAANDGILDSPPGEGRDGHLESKKWG